MNTDMNTKTARRLDKERVRRQADFERLVRKASSKVKGRPGQRQSTLARCPFHDDHDPSMSVDFAKGAYHCFACGAGGDIFQWVMRRRQMSFLEAMAWLAEEFNIEPQG